MDKRDFIKSIGMLGLAGAVAHSVAENTVPAGALDDYISKNQKAFDEILTKGKIRAAYIILPPEFDKNPVTGTLTGIAHDIAEAAAKKLNLMIDWTEETSFATMHEGLGTRFDALFFTLYRNANFGRVVDYTRAFFFSSTSIYVRANDTRFDADINAINSPAITISTKDGDMSPVLAAQRFPNAKQLSLPNSAEHSQMLQDVIQKKADVAMVNTIAADKFLEQSPGSLKNITAQEPLAVFGHAFVVAKGQTLLRDLLDLALEELQHSGAIDQILKAYEPFPNAYRRVASPYN